MWYEKSQEYWNGEYADYWRKVVGGQLRKGDGPSGGDEFSDFLDFAELSRGMRVYDAGCGYGRLFSVLFERGLYVSGVDISQTYIDEINQNMAGHHLLEDAWCGSTETVYRANYFDRVLCFSCFDCLPQEKTINAFARSLKIGGIMTFHAKNRFYQDSDEQALHAEKASVANEFPISFIDYNILASNLMKNGLKINRTLFFERRGDLAAWNYCEEQPSHFYEFLIQIEKTEDVDEFTWDRFSFDCSTVAGSNTNRC